MIYISNKTNVYVKNEGKLSVAKLFYKRNEIFISTQFFNSDRNAVIEWDKGHCI